MFGSSRKGRGSSPRPPKPLPQALGYPKKQQQEQLIKAAIAMTISVLVFGSILPSPLFGLDWQAMLWEQVADFLLKPFPQLPKGMQLPTWFHPLPVIQWVWWTLALAGVVFILSLIQHLMALYLQRTRPLGVERTYFRVRVPGSVSLKPQDGTRLLQTLHGVLPPTDLKGGSPTPLVLRWSAQPEQTITQGVSVAGDGTFQTSIKKTLEGLSRGTEVDAMSDPVADACIPGRLLAWCDVGLSAPDDLPIAIPGGGESPLLDALLPALSPQRGVFLADVQVLLRPIPDRTWRLKVKARLEGLRVDADGPERKTMDQKAAGPAFDTTIRLLAVADSSDSAQAMVRTMASALAASAQAVAQAQQKLQPGPILVAPFAASLPVPLSRSLRIASLGLGLGAAIGVVVGLVTLGPLGPRVVHVAPVVAEVKATATARPRPTATPRPTPRPGPTASPRPTLDAGRAGGGRTTSPITPRPKRGPRKPGGYIVWQGIPGGTNYRYALPALIIPLPALLVAARRRKRGQAQLPMQLQMVQRAGMPLRNPRSIPIWADWFGHKPVILSAAEITTLWHPPTVDIGDRVSRVKARRIPAPARAFVDPENPRNLILGLGKRSDDSWAPVGMPYEDLRYILHVTAPMGRGKSEWSKNLFLRLTKAGAGFLAIDCKGTDLVNGTIPLIPLEREGDVTILDLGGSMVTGEDMRPAMNLLSPAFGASLGLKPSQLASTVLGVFSTLDKNFDDAVGIKQFANMGMLALLEGEPKATMMHLIRFFGDDDYRADVISRVRTMQVKDFWDRRFEVMPEGQKSSLFSFERRLDQLLAYPELAAMLVSPGCSIDLRSMMDNNGILLAGIRATEGQIASIAATLLLTQMTLAALSRSNVPESQRPDWPVIIDEAQIVFGQNPGMAPVIFSQLRAFRIGTVVIHQNLDQLANIMQVLAGNAQNRAILGSEVLDAGKYGSDYAALGLSKEDFTGMERFSDLYLKVYGCGELFSARMLPMAQPLQEQAPPPVFENWRLVTAHAARQQDRDIDHAIAQFRELAKVRWDEAVQRLGILCKDRPEQFDAYCRRTKEHRAAQRNFILRNPGCIPIDPTLSGDRAMFAQKDQRIRILSTLKSGVPKLETEALQWALLMAAREAQEAQARRAEEEAAAAKAAKAAATQANREAAKAAKANQKAVGTAGVATMPLNTTLTDESGAPLPNVQQLTAERPRRRTKDDAVAWEVDGAI